MELMKWNPMKDFFNVPSRFDTIFDDFFYPARRASGQEAALGWNPAVDVYESDDAIVVKAELPGMNKDQISVEMEGHLLTIKGERSSENEVKENNYYRRERTQGSFRRTLALPGEVDPETIKADYKDGVLKIEVPKPEEKKPKQISVH